MLVRKLQESGMNVRGCPQSRATKGTVLWFQLARQVGLETTPRAPAGSRRCHREARSRAWLATVQGGRRIEDVLPSPASLLAR